MDEKYISKIFFCILEKIHFGVCLFWSLFGNENETFLPDVELSSAEFFLVLDLCIE